MDILSYAQFLKEKGVLYNDTISAGSISDYVNVTLLRKQDTLAALDLLKSLKQVVLGGDVYIKQENKYVPAYANWHCDPEAGEDWDKLVERSYDIAKNYISNYKEKPDEETFYLIVVKTT